LLRRGETHVNSWAGPGFGRQKRAPATGDIERDEILATSGSQQAIFLLDVVLVDDATTVGIENPGYSNARNNFALCTKHVWPLRVDAVIG